MLVGDPPMSVFFGLCSWKDQTLQGRCFCVLPEGQGRLKAPLPLEAGQGPGRDSSTQQPRGGGSLCLV